MAECKSYTPSEDASKQEKSKLSQKAMRTNTIVDCAVRGCIFNSEGACIANGITVATLSTAPECCTTKPR
jgi:hypothetical protein